jgi:methionine-rich copper-binding protein CopC
MDGMKHISRAFGVAAAAGLFVLGVAAPADAHPTVVSRSPEDGATVSEAPSEVSVEFDEVVTNADLDVFDPCGTQVDNGSPQALGRTVSVGMSADKAGTYSVDWVVISEDGHNVRGNWSFTSSGGAACPGSGGGSGGGNGGGSGGSTGGGSGGSGGGSSTGGDTRSGDTDPGTDDGSTLASGGDGSTGGGGKHKGHAAKERGSKDKGKHEGHGTSEEPRRVDLISDEPGGGKNSDIPVDWLLISFAIAGLIGAAGGSIYASIVGPR